ncbi:MAG: thiamine pyrophosphate-dependent enzyme, partial [Pseudomonadota bacterium]
MDAIDASHLTFLDALEAERWPDLPETQSAETGETLLRIYRSQCLSRHLDRTARLLQKDGEAYYTIGSSGHEGMAAVAEAVRPGDMAFLHYRDGAFQIQRALQAGGESALESVAWDMLLSFTASSEDPISGGRHKVLGSAALNIPPQTSTIASHLPKAVGAAYGLGLRKRLKMDGASSADGLVLCSFGDASVNHSTAQGAFNAAGWAAYQSAALPLLFVCEDNGIGISVKTPEGWIAANFRDRPGLRYFAGDGLDVVDALSTARAAAAYARQQRKPAFLHLQMVRLFGHAGSDVEAAYRDAAEIAAQEARDPLLRSAARLVNSGAASAEEAREIYVEVGEICADLAKRVVARPKLATREEVAASLLPKPVGHNRRRAMGQPGRITTSAHDARAQRAPQPMARLINRALADAMAAVPEAVIAGEDVGRKGGVYGVTRGLQKSFGADRVIDTLLDEQSILGLSIGLAHCGFLPIPEIQFLAYLHNAEDQLRGEAATLPFFSNGQYSNPMIVRIAGLGYQRGFGGHFHNDNSLAVLRDIPGLAIACPSNGADAVRLLRGAMHLAMEERRVVVFVEPIAL